MKPSSSPADDAKKRVGEEIAARIRDGEVIGLGTGSTVEAAIAAIARRIKREGIRVRAVPTSIQSAQSGERAGIEVLHPTYGGPIAWGFDGADEVNEKLWVIKGKGGAMLQEKILAVRCGEFVIVVDESKMVSELGAIHPVPIEVIPSAVTHVERALSVLRAREVTVRQAAKKHGPVITEGGNLIIDARFPSIGEELEGELKGIVGVVETGLFIHYASEVWIAGETGVRKIARD